MEDFEKEEFINTELMIIIVATHGEGEPTDNSLRLHTWIKNAVKAKEGKLMKNVKYAVFGLGDKEYENFCAMGKFFDKKLEELGANRVFDAGFGDSSNELEAQYETWKSNLWTTLIKHYEQSNTNATKKERSAPIKKNLYPLKMAEPGSKVVDHAIQPLCIRQYVQGKDAKIHSMRE